MTKPQTGKSNEAPMLRYEPRRRSIFDLAASPWMPVDEPGSGSANDQEPPHPQNEVDVSPEAHPQAGLDKNLKIALFLTWLIGSSAFIVLFIAGGDRGIAYSIIAINCIGLLAVSAFMTVETKVLLIGLSAVFLAVGVGTYLVASEKEARANREAEQKMWQNYAVAESNVALKEKSDKENARHDELASASVIKFQILRKFDENNGYSEFEAVCWEDTPKKCVLRATEDEAGKYPSTEQKSFRVIKEGSQPFRVTETAKLTGISHETKEYYETYRTVH